MDQPSHLPRDPVLTCAARVHAAVDEAAAADPVLMTTTEKAQAMVELTRAADRIRGILLRVLAESGDVADDAGAAAWPRGWPTTPTSATAPPSPTNASPTPSNTAGTRPAPDSSPAR